MPAQPRLKPLGIVAGGVWHQQRFATFVRDLPGGLHERFAQTLTPRPAVHPYLCHIGAVRLVPGLIQHHLGAALAAGCTGFSCSRWRRVSALMHDFMKKNGFSPYVVGGSSYFFHSNSAEERAVLPGEKKAFPRAAICDPGDAFFCTFLWAAATFLIFVRGAGAHSMDRVLKKGF